MNMRKYLPNRFPFYGFHGCYYHEESSSAIDRKWISLSPTSVGIFFGLNPGREMRLNLVYSPFCDARECQRVCFSIPPGVHSDSDKFVLLSIERPRGRPLDEPFIFIFLLILCFNAPSCPPNLIPSEHLTLKCFRLFSILFCVLRIFTFFLQLPRESSPSESDV